MNRLDLINALFEATGAVVIWLNFRRLLRDRSIKGVDWRVTLFYAFWGAWNLPYYYGVGHWLSCAASVGICVGNTSWVLLALKIMRRDARHARRAGVDHNREAQDVYELNAPRLPDYTTRMGCQCAVCKNWRARRAEVRA